MDYFSSQSEGHGFPTLQMKTEAQRGEGFGRKPFWKSWGVELGLVAPVLPTLLEFAVLVRSLSLQCLRQQKLQQVISQQVQRQSDSGLGPLDLGWVIGVDN